MLSRYSTSLPQIHLKTPSSQVPVPHGPFSVKVRPESEPDKVQVNIDSATIRLGQPTKFRIDSTEAGNGDLVSLFSISFFFSFTILLQNYISCI